MTRPRDAQGCGPREAKPKHRRGPSRKVSGRRRPPIKIDPPPQGRLGFQHGPEGFSPWARSAAQPPLGAPGTEEVSGPIRQGGHPADMSHRPAARPPPPWGVDSPIRQADMDLRIAHSWTAQCWAKVGALFKSGCDGDSRPNGAATWRQAVDQCRGVTAADSGQTVPSVRGAQADALLGGGRGPGRGRALAARAVTHGRPTGGLGWVSMNWRAAPPPLRGHSPGFWLGLSGGQQPAHFFPAVA